MDKKKIFFSISNLKIMTAEHLLKEAGIEFNIINKLDTAYAGVFGNIELYVRPEDVERAKVILSEAEIL